jgi:hypothetical protein
MNKQLNAQQDFEELLLKATQYSGSRKSGEKVISASSINREPYFLLVQHLFDKQEQLSYGANTTGSLYQLGLDSALATYGNGRWKTAQRLTHKLPNGWTISGEYDIFEPQPLEFFKGYDAPPRISSLREKVEYLTELGVYTDEIYDIYGY